MAQDTDVKIAEAIAMEAEKLATKKPSGGVIWDRFKHKSLQLLGGLLMEKNKDGVWTISLGRVSFWMAFIPALVIWAVGKGSLDGGAAVKDIAPNHLTVLLTLMGYNFGKKIADTVNNVWGKNDGPG